MTDKVVLFGTKGGPRLIKGGSWPTSHALVLAGKVFIIDAGLGVVRQFVEAGFSYDQIETIFITHHHSDHNLELGGLVYTSWVGAPAHPIQVFGPAGLNNLMTHFLKSQSFDIDIRLQDEGLKNIHDYVSCHEYSQGLIYDAGGVQVSALRVKHPPVSECYALKFETKTAKIVFGADTTYFPALADFARDADILVHEVMHKPSARKICDILKDTKPDLWQHFLASHTSCEDVGRIAQAAGCKKLVLNHFVPEIGFHAKAEDFEQGVRTTFSGELIIGKDGLSIPVK